VFKSLKIGLENHIQNLIKSEYKFEILNENSYLTISINLKGMFEKVWQGEGSAKNLASTATIFYNVC
jgi:hypothetical protein